MARAGVPIAARWDVGEGCGINWCFSGGICHRGSETQSGNRLPKDAGWPIVGGVARVAQLDRALASEAEG
jgi:hypothetical protein